MTMTSKLAASSVGGILTACRVDVRGGQVRVVVMVRICVWNKAGRPSRETRRCQSSAGQSGTRGLGTKPTVTRQCTSWATQDSVSNFVTDGVVQYSLLQQAPNRLFNFKARFSLLSMVKIKLVQACYDRQFRAREASQRRKV
jgi:hypothetical protein